MVTSIKDICKYPGCTHKTVIHLKAKVDAEAQSTWEPAEDLHYEVDVCADHLGNSTDFLHDCISNDCDFMPSVKLDRTKGFSENHAYNYGVGEVLGSKKLKTIKGTITGRLSGTGSPPNIEEVEKEQKSLHSQIPTYNHDVIEIKGKGFSEELERVRFEDIPGIVSSIIYLIPRFADELLNILSKDRKIVENAKNMKYPRPLHAIAIEIKSDWKNPSIHTVPYINALAAISFIESYYLADRGDDIVLRFLSNARIWKGEVARRIKKELNQMLREFRTALIDCGE